MRVELVKFGFGVLRLLILQLGHLTLPHGLLHLQIPRAGFLPLIHAGDKRVANALRTWWGQQSKVEFSHG